MLTTALALVDAEGLEALSMRRLGAELGRDPMGLYRYAKNRADLLDGITEVVLEKLVIPTDGSDWQQQLRATAHDFRDLALAHPHVVPLLVTRPLSTPLGLRPLGTLRPLENILDLLIRAGFTPEDALHVYRAYYGYLYGHILNELQEMIVDEQENEDLLRLGLLWRCAPNWTESRLGTEPRRVTQGVHRFSLHLPLTDSRPGQQLHGGPPGRSSQRRRAPPGHGVPPSAPSPGLEIREHLPVTAVTGRSTAPAVLDSRHVRCALAGPGLPREAPDRHGPGRTPGHRLLPSRLRGLP